MRTGGVEANSPQAGGYSARLSMMQGDGQLLRADEEF